MLGVGFNNFVPINKIIAFSRADSNPARRLIHSAKDRDMLVDVTQGRKTRSIVVMESGHLVLSSIEPATLQDRVRQKLEMQGNGVKKGAK